MNTVISISFTIKDLICFVFGILGFGIAVYLLLILREFYGFIKSSKELYCNNKDHINSLIKDSANIINRVNLVSENISKSEIFDLDIKNTFPLLQSLFSIVTSIFNKKTNN